MLSAGIDIVSIARFRFINTPGGVAFYRRVFTLAEQQACGVSLSLLATCFAAKEAVSKVLKTGLGIGSMDHVTCHSIEILNIEMAQPKVYLSGTALQIAKRTGLDRFVLCRDHIGGTVLVSAMAASGISTSELGQELQAMHVSLLTQLTKNIRRARPVESSLDDVRDLKGSKEISSVA